MALKQNNLAEATTELGFPAETSIPLEREVTLEDGTVVKVAGVTPEKLATDLGITFKTPGEPYITSSGEILNGVVQTYNEEPAATLVSIAITTPPTRQVYQIGDIFDSTGMVVTATYDDESTKTVVGYTITPSGALAETDTKVTVSYTEGEVTKTAEQAITVIEKLNEITLIPNKSYTLNYEALANFIKDKLTESGTYDIIENTPIIGFGCGHNPPAIQLGFNSISNKPMGIVETYEALIAFGTDSSAYTESIHDSWFKEGTLRELINLLESTGSDVVSCIAR